MWYQCMYKLITSRTMNNVTHEATALDSGFVDNIVPYGTIFLVTSKFLLYQYVFYIN